MKWDKNEIKENKEKKSIELENKIMQFYVTNQVSVEKADSTLFVDNM